MGIRLENVDYVYAAGTAEEKKALDDINLKIMMVSLSGLSVIRVRANRL